MLKTLKIRDFTKSSLFAFIVWFLVWSIPMSLQYMSIIIEHNADVRLLSLWFIAHLALASMILGFNGQGTER